jgi:hypothetical protein
MISFIESTYKIGHEVYIEGCGIGMASGHISDHVIDDVDVKYNEDTGEPFHIYKIDGRWWTDGGHGAGGPYKSNYMYDVIYDEEKWIKYMDSK